MTLTIEAKAAAAKRHERLREIEADGFGLAIGHAILTSRPACFMNECALIGL